MNQEQIREAELKLEAYKAATASACASKSYGALTQCAAGPTAGEIKAEAERLWAWMVAK